jgi:hypothetical protein
MFSSTPKKSVSNILSPHTFARSTKNTHIPPPLEISDFDSTVYNVNSSNELPPLPHNDNNYLYLWEEV